MTLRSEPLAQTPEDDFTRADLFRYASGDLNPQRAAVLEQRAKVDAELAGQIQFFQSMVNGVLDDEEADD